MRRVFARGPIVKEVREQALSDKKGPRGGKMYICNECKESFPAKSIQIDHRVEVIPLDKASADMSLDEIVMRMWCKTTWDGETDMGNLQALCLTCHKAKTKGETAIRVANRKKRKEKDAK